MLEHTIQGAEKERLWVYNKGRGLKGEDGKIYIDGVMIDITEQKMFEKQTKQLETQFQKIQKLESIGRLTGGIAHDFNNLLTPILGYTELLENEIDSSGSAAEYIRQIIDASLMSKKLIQQLLSYSRKQKLVYQSVNLNELITSIQPLLNGSLRDNILLETKLDDSLPEIRADKTQLEQILMNLCVNARDAMPEGGVLTISTSTVIPEVLSDKIQGKPPVGRYLILAVADTGLGIDEDSLEHIFEPFFSTKGDLGTGLGLATVYGIIKQHNGEIAAVSSKGGGTGVYMYFPVGEE